MEACSELDPSLMTGSAGPLKAPTPESRLKRPSPTKQQSINITEPSQTIHGNGMPSIDDCACADCVQLTDREFSVCTLICSSDGPISFGAAQRGDRSSPGDSVEDSPEADGCTAS